MSSISDIFLVYPLSFHDLMEMSKLTSTKWHCPNNLKFGWLRFSSMENQNMNLA